MWTNFDNGNYHAMETARLQMNDFRLIRNSSNLLLQPVDTIDLHEQFVGKLLTWFNLDVEGPRIVVTHHAPVINPTTQYRNSPLMPAFNSLDMLEVIRSYQPVLWMYGHTHECDDQMVNNTRVISNQLGYPKRPNGYECPQFREDGYPVTIIR